MPDAISGRVGLALGSGAARGWAHVGVIRALEEAGIVPEIVCGCSVGAVVGAAYASGKLDAFERWVMGLERGQVLRNLDLSLHGGLLKGDQFFDFMSPGLPDGAIEELPRAFGAVATDLSSGHEVWLREGSLHRALRASVAMPGLIAPAAIDGRWLVDGGLVNPVPVSLCRAMGADWVVAVDLNTALLGRRAFSAVSVEDPLEAAAELDAGEEGSVAALTQDEGDGAGRDASGRLLGAVEAWARELRDRMAGSDRSRSRSQPSLYDVLANSLNIMQVRITRSRMAGDPADLLVTPRLPDLALLDLDRGAEAIAEGRRACERALAAAAE